MTLPTGDRTNLGVWALQDHQSGLGVADRMFLSGARLVDPDGGDEWFHTYDVEKGKPVVGDIHPWRWWRADSREHGAFTMAMMCRVVDASISEVDGQGRQITGGSIGRADVKPVRTRGYDADDAFATSEHVMPEWWPAAPKGFVMLGMAGTREGGQEDVLGWLDPRIVAADRNGADAMGSRIIDLDPENEASEERVAKAQTHWRVAHVTGLDRLGAVPGWVAAWHMTRTEQGREAGFGAVYGTLDSRDAPATTGGSSPRRGAITGTPGAGAPSAAAGSVDAGARDGGGAGKRKKGVALASREAWGPFHLGHENDRHRFGTNDDGEPVNSLHLDPDRAMWFRRQDRDAPLEFDTSLYGPSRAPMRVRAWIRYDPLSVHPWNGEQREGLWRLEAESYFEQKRDPRRPGDVTPPVEPRDPAIPPGDPETPNSNPPPVQFGRPAYPGEDGGPPLAPPSQGAPQRPGGDWRYPPNEARPGDPGYRRRPGDGFGLSWRYVGQTERSAPAEEGVAYSPMQIGFPGALVFPQHTGRGGVDLRYSEMPPRESIEEARATTPAVGRWTSYGAQEGETWAYTQEPGYSRVPGGTAPGGLMWGPPEVDELDRDEDFAPAGVGLSETYTGWLPGAYAAWGVPGANGLLEECAWRAKRTVSAGTVYSALNFETVDGTNTWSTALVCQKDVNGVGVGVGGTSYLKMPTGTSAQRPVTPANGMVRYNSTLGAIDAYVGGAWRNLHHDGAAVPGTLLAVTAYAAGATGNHTWNASATEATVIMVGGGGGGGGVAGTTAGQSACAGGGAAGAFLKHHYTTLPASPAYGVGAGGAGGAAGGAAGTAGGNTTFGALTAPGGGGGAFGAESAATGIVTGGSTTAASGANVVNGGGNPGGAGIKLGAAVAMGGLGGCSNLGGAGGLGGINDQAGANGIGPGSGGGGACSTSASGTDFAGGDGQDGVIIVFEYA